MRIPCPLCGERGAEEFAYHGDATLRDPARAAPPETWADYVYLRDNPPGTHRELWYHGRVPGLARRRARRADPRCVAADSPATPRGSPAP